MSAVGLLLVLLIMGGLAVAVLAAVGRSGTTTLPTLPPGLITTLPPEPGGALPPAGNDATAAEQIACRSNYQAVRQAVDYYETLNGHPPPSMAALGSILKDNIDSSAYTITIDSHHRDQIDVATQGHPASAGDGNCSFA